MKLAAQYQVSMAMNIRRAGLRAAVTPRNVKVD